MKIRKIIRGFSLLAFAFGLFMNAGKFEAHAANHYGLSSILGQTLQPGDTVKLNQDLVLDSYVSFSDGFENDRFVSLLEAYTIYEIKSFEDYRAEYPEFLSYPEGYSAEDFQGWEVEDDTFYQDSDIRLSLGFKAVWKEKTGQIQTNKRVSASHTSHSYEWITILEPTAETDGLLAYRCRECGDVSQMTMVSGMGTFVKQSIDQITKAQKNSNVIISSKVWYSFPKSVYEAIQARPDLSVTINFTYKNKNYTVTIPAGADVLSLVDENGYCGFLKLNEVFGGKEVI